MIQESDFALTPEDFALLNPNTKTCPVFRSQADAELTNKIYRRVPVLIDESQGESGNPWGIRFMAMLHMANDSGLFRTYAQLREAGWQLDGMVWTLPGGERWLPLYEAKMIHHFDHRWATYAADGESAHDTTEAEKQDPAFRPMPRYWVAEREVDGGRLRDKAWDHGWLLGWRDICRSTDERTVIAAATPRVGVGNKIPLLLPSPRIEPHMITGLIGNLGAMVFAMWRVRRLVEPH